MSAVAQFFLLAAIEVAGLFAIWFLIRAKVRRYLELENLLAGVRDEARALVLELNETADRNVSLVEDRMVVLRDLLGDVDRRIGVERRELEARDAEREVYAKLSRRRPIVPSSDRPPGHEQAPQVQQPVSPGVAAGTAEAPITLNLGSSEVPSAPSHGEPRSALDIVVAENSVIPPKSRREEAFELYRRGFSADLIAARIGATVAEIELLIEIEERRSAGNA
jgi:hypothetical protein